MPEWLKGVNIREALGYGPQESASGTIADHVNLVGSTTLAPHFEATAPEYPAFSGRSRRSAGRKRRPMRYA